MTTHEPRSDDLLGNYKHIAEHALDSPDIHHNIGNLRRIWGGMEIALADPVDFDPRDGYWRKPERRFLIDYLAYNFKDWPVGVSEEAFAEFSAGLGTRIDELRESEKITAYGVNTDRAGGLAVVMDPVLQLSQNYPKVERWADMKVGRSHAPSAAQSLSLFCEAVIHDGFRKYNANVGRRFRWYAVLGARTAEDITRGQRFFNAYRNALLSHNAYRRAGAQYFGPIVGNTGTKHFLDVLAKWKNGVTTAEAPLMGFTRESEELSDVSDNNIVRELWGFLNLHEQPFYNSQVEFYRQVDSDPEKAVRSIGKRTLEWLADHPDVQGQLATRFDQLIADPQVESTFSRYPVRRYNDRTGRGSEFDQSLYLEIRQVAEGVLRAKPANHKAAIMLHLALDNLAYGQPSAGKPDYVADGPMPSYGPAVKQSLGSLREYDRVWLYAPGRSARHWAVDKEQQQASIDYPELGDLSQYENPEAMLEVLREHRDSGVEPSGEARTCWRFAREIKVGDPILARKGRSRIIGVGVVTQEYSETPEVEYGDHIGVKWLWTGDHVIRDKRSLPVVTLAQASGRKNLLAELELAFGLGEEEAIDGEEETLETYSRTDALSDLFIRDEKVDEMVGLLRRKKNLVIQGPPGVGKTFVAKRLAYLILEARDESRLRFVQFHQAYTYEQFVRGYRPDGEGGFELANGPLYELAETAKSDEDRAYVLIIDEINRGNLSKILGEGMMLLESDKRSEDWALQLAYTRSTEDEEEAPFYLPPNLYVIGTMNTADRSLAVVDYALRRRFSFVDLEPGFGHARFLEHLSELTAEIRGDILSRLRGINQMIREDGNLGDGFLVGHSYFCKGVSDGAGPWGDQPREWMENILRYEIFPLLREYWYDDKDRLGQAAQVLGLD